jgi:hypothetical protein
LGRVRGSAWFASALLCAMLFAAQPARADRCDDLAAQLKSQIDGIAIGKTAANSIFLSHPAAKQVRLGCASRNVRNELAATADSRKPSSAFQELVAGAAAIVFTIPKPDTLKGVARCFGRVGLLRGDDITTRYRRLDMRCVRSKTDSSITISRGKDE